MSTLLEIKQLKKHFKTPNGLLHAVDGVSFKIETQKTLGVVGESGCGKSTLGRTIVHLTPKTSGEIFFEGQDITHIDKASLKALRPNLQMIFQDPYSSLNPRMSVFQTISEPLIINRVETDRRKLSKRVLELMDIVGLSSDLANAFPHELDGGRRQRIGVARALALKPKFIVCDEPVSALDVSIQAQILNLMQDLQDELGLTYLFITHDLSVVKHISDDILVMYMGKMVEYTTSSQLFQNRYHPYTKALLSAVPIPEVGAKKERSLLKGEISSPVNPKPGCRFAARCTYAKDKCRTEEPAFEAVAPGHFVACHFVREINQL
jgi:peptide/nickel transport system ATP-binding protein